MSALTEKVIFVMTRARMYGVTEMAPIFAIGWINLLHQAPCVNKIYTIKEVTAAFAYLGRRGVMRRKVVCYEAWLTRWVLN